MSESSRSQLLSQLAAGLESGEEQPVTPLVRKAVRLASLLGELEYRTLFQLHLDGIGPRESARVHTVSGSGEQSRRVRATQALLSDREFEGMVNALALPEVERLLGHLERLDDAGTLLQRQGLHRLLQRVRNRLGLFAVEAEAVLERGHDHVSAPHVVAQDPTVFIGHGASFVWKDLKDFLHDRLGLEWAEFNREASAGFTVTERLEQMLAKSTFAFLVMTADDQHGDGSMHARENVVHEIGLCQGRLGRHRAIVLLEDGCAEFSNITGLVQVRFPKHNILAVSEELRRLLEREQLIASADHGSPTGA